MRTYKNGMYWMYNKSFGRIGSQNPDYTIGYAVEQYGLIDQIVMFQRREHAIKSVAQKCPSYISCQIKLVEQIGML